MYAFAAIAGSASAQKASGAERGLIGINLYDSGAKVVALYGSPDEIQAVSLGGGSASAGSGFGGPGFGGAGGPGGPRGGGRPGAGPAASGSSADQFGPFNFGDDLFRQSLLQRPGRGGGGLPPSGGPPGGAAGPSGAPPGFGPSGPGGGAPGGFPGGGATGGATETTQYTRWVYNRAGSKYGFIIDTQGHVVQIEAIGMQNNRVKTRKGLGFGATFAQLIKTYGNPDGYEVGGDTILVKYLVDKKVAFRLTRLGEKKPHVVTGVVVAAGKV